METSQRRMTPAEAFITKGLAVIVVIIAAIVLRKQVDMSLSFAIMAATCALLLVGWIGTNHRATEREAKLKHEINNIKTAQSQHFHMTLDLLARLLCRTQPYWIKGNFLIIRLETGVHIQITLSDSLKMHCKNPNRSPVPSQNLFQGIEVFRSISNFAKSEQGLDVDWLQALVDAKAHDLNLEDVLLIGMRHRRARQIKNEQVNIYGIELE